MQPRDFGTDVCAERVQFNNIDLSREKERAISERSIKRERERDLTYIGRVVGDNYKLIGCTARGLQ